VNWRLRVVGRFDAPSFRFAISDNPCFRMRLRVGSILFEGRRSMTRDEYETTKYRKRCWHLSASGDDYPVAVVCASWRHYEWTVWDSDGMHIAAHSPPRDRKRPPRPLEQALMEAGAALLPLLTAHERAAVLKRAGLQVTPKDHPCGDNHASVAFCRTDATQPDGGFNRVGKVGCGAWNGCSSSERR